MFPDPPTVSMFSLDCFCIVYMVLLVFLVFLLLLNLNGVLVNNSSKFLIKDYK